MSLEIEPVIKYHVTPAAIEAQLGVDCIKRAAEDGATAWRKAVVS